MKHFILFLPLLLLLVGCNGGKPAGFPKTAPCEITVLKNGTPQPGVEVLLALQPNGNGALVVSANTDSNGKAELQTRWARYVRKGVPLGTSKITLVKHANLPDDGMTDEKLARMSPKEALAYEKKRTAEIDALREVPKQLSSPKTTPLEITIDEKGTKLTVDIADYTNDNVAEKPAG
jgi:hypothetical protein